MRADVAAGFLSPQEEEQAKQIVRSCVHCGMCSSACPTYLEDADERDSPRGRIYLVNEMLREGKPSAVALRHLDRCLSCRACETACPSGVRYGELADIGRHAAEPARPLRQRIANALVAEAFGSPRLMRAAAAACAAFRPLLPAGLRAHFRRRRRPRFADRTRRVIMLSGCVEGAFSPQTHAALADILDVAGIGLINIPDARCCGALRFHLGRRKAGLADMRANVAAWAPLLKSGAAEAVVMTSSGCHRMVADYARLLDGPDAAIVQEKTISAAELLEKEWPAIAPRLRPPEGPAVAYHSPCSMQHGLPLAGRVEKLLAAAGYDVRVPEEPGTCCGSAGAYSILQPGMARRLRARKLARLKATHPADSAPQTATANIGCQLFLSAAAPRHWLELIAAAIAR